MKKVLILGAGIYQVPLIKRAKELGLYTIVTSVEGNYPGFKYADKCYYENTTNRERILEIAKEERIDAILTSGTDVAVTTIGYVCKELGLNGVSEESSRLVTDKSLMKDAFFRGGVRTATHKTVDSVEDAKKAAVEIGLPVMLKCVNSSGSRGVVKVTEVEEIEKAFEYATSVTEKNYIVVEKFIEGYEIGLDGYIIDENQSLFVPHDKIVYSNGKTNVPIGHIFPCECSQELYDDILEQAKKAVKALGLSNCFFNMDILVNGTEAYILEVGARVGATCIPELVSLHYDIDFYEMMLDVALGNEIDAVGEPCQASAGQLLYSEKEGVVESISYDEMEDVEVQFDVEIGESVSKFHTGNNRIGHMIAADSTIEGALKKLETMKTHITLEVS